MSPNKCPKCQAERTDQIKKYLKESVRYKCGTRLYIDGSIQQSTPCKETEEILELGSPKSETLTQCPTCGYTIEDCRLNLDHALCSNYPFFSNEK